MWAGGVECEQMANLIVALEEVAPRCHRPRRNVAEVRFQTKWEIEGSEEVADRDAQHNAKT